MCIECSAGGTNMCVFIRAFSWFEEEKKVIGSHFTSRHLQLVSWLDAVFSIVGEDTGELTQKLDSLATCLTWPVRLVHNLETLWK